jgi:hypothetical protein
VSNTTNTNTLTWAKDGSTRWSANESDVKIHKTKAGFILVIDGDEEGATTHATIKAAKVFAAGELTARAAMAEMGLGGPEETTAPVVDLSREANPKLVGLDRLIAEIAAASSTVRVVDGQAAIIDKDCSKFHLAADGGPKTACGKTLYPEFRSFDNVALVGCGACARTVTYKALFTEEVVGA